jgi:Plasmid pRiA4b ORF-3-like protein
LAKLHQMFQAAMGWTDSHLHGFTIGDQRYGMHFDDYPEGEIDEAEISVLKAVGGHRRFSYEYDFGDSWDHDVVVEEVTTTSRGLRFAVCIDGQNACPPEDCGGPGGYAELLETLADPGHPDHDRAVQWVGGSFDPTSFDLVSANVALQQLR